MAMRPMPWKRRTDAERDCKAVREEVGCRDAYLDKKNSILYINLLLAEPILIETKGR